MSSAAVPPPEAAPEVTKEGLRVLWSEGRVGTASPRSSASLDNQTRSAISGKQKRSELTVLHSPNPSPMLSPLSRSSFPDLRRLLQIECRLRDFVCLAFAIPVEINTARSVADSVGTEYTKDDIRDVASAPSCRERQSTQPTISETFPSSPSKRSRLNLLAANSVARETRDCLFHSRSFDRSEGGRRIQGVLRKRLREERLVRELPDSM